MQAARLCYGVPLPPSAMIRISAGLRSLQARAAVHTLLVKHFPSSPADYTASAIALRGTSQTSDLGDRRRQAPLTAPTRNPLPDVTAGGGPRPKKPRAWRTKTKRGSIAKASKLVDVVNKLSNSKEEVYGALDAWIAWDLEFPLVAVKKALQTLREGEDWRRIIQVCKWMLEKGQGRTLGTYQLLLQAFDHEGRIEEAEELWQRIFRENMECIPRSMFAQVIGMYDRHGRYKDLLKVFVDMEELQVKPDPGTAAKAAKAYSHYGYEEHAQSVLANYPISSVDARGPNVKSRFGKGRPGMVESEHKPRVETHNGSKEMLGTTGSREIEDAPTSSKSNETDINDRPLARQDLEECEELQESSSGDSSLSEQRPYLGAAAVLEDDRNTASEKSTTREIGNDGEGRLVLESYANEEPTAVTRDGMRGHSAFETDGRLQEISAFEVIHGREESVTLEINTKSNEGSRDGFQTDDQSGDVGEIPLKEKPTLKDGLRLKSAQRLNAIDAKMIKV